MNPEETPHNTAIGAPDDDDRKLRDIEKHAAEYPGSLLQSNYASKTEREKARLALVPKVSAVMQTASFEDELNFDVGAAIKTHNQGKLWEPDMLERLALLNETDFGIVLGRCKAAFPNFAAREFRASYRKKQQGFRQSERDTAPAAAAPHAAPGLLGGFLQNDHGNSGRLVAMYGNDLRYCPPLRKWLVWDGRRWAVDTSDHARRLAKKTMIEYLDQAVGANDDSAQKFARASLDTKRITNALREAQDQIFVMPDNLDKDPYLLNFMNQTVDLRTGEGREHCREDYITRLVQYNFDPAAKCPRFLRFLDEVTGVTPDAAEAAIDRSKHLTEYLQRAFGYSLTGVTSEKVVFLLHGLRDNGKSTLLATFRSLLGEYAVLMQIDTLMAKSGADSNNAQADLADLRGARFVMTSETEEGQRLAEAKIKRITQGIGRIKATRKYENPIEFDETHKLWIDANHLPGVRSHDDAIWRRLRAIPFTVTIPREQQDRELGAKLLAEAEGILALAVCGAVAWYCKGLGQPLEVEQANAVWRADMNQVGRFIDECCVTGVGQARARELFQAYQRWAESVGEHAVAERAFSERVLEQDDVRSETKNFGRLYLGIGLKATEQRGDQ